MTKTDARELGAKGLDVPASGLRPESFAYLRQPHRLREAAAGRGAIGDRFPILIAFYPEGTRGIVDGRHRLSLARELGLTHVRGRLIGYGPRGGVVWSYSGQIPI